MNQKRCSKCLLPDTYPGIKYNSEGICNFCLGFQPPNHLGENALLISIRGESQGQYDCLVGISGGRDSCYVAYIAKEKLKLRTLGVFYDSPFYTDLARRNIIKVSETLGLDVITVKTKNNLEYRFVRNHLTSIAGAGTAWGQCNFCHYGIDAILYNMAKVKHIPIILSGFTRHEQMGPMNRGKIFGTMIKKIVRIDPLRFIYYQVRAYILLVRQRRQFKLPCNSIFDVYRRARVPSTGPQVIPIFDYVSWDQNEIEETLIKKLSWRRPNLPIAWGYDCILEPLLAYSYMKEWKISTVGIYLANLIRMGQMERGQALRILQEIENEKTIKNKVEYVFDFLRIPPSARNRFFESQ